MNQDGNTTVSATRAQTGGVKLDYPRPGFKIGEYVIEEVLGHGAMATVYLARDTTGHEVALKVFQEGPGVSKTMLERFRREAEASKKLRRHPHIMTIYITGKEGPYHYIAMEYIKRSKTFEAALESTPMSLQTVVHVIIKIARALQYAHGRNIVHRDVKLTNIMIDEFGEPLLADFGVAELIDWPSCTMSGALTGTPLYMSPEQARGERVGLASDIYSLGVVLYEAAAGVLPYSAHHRSRVKEVLEAVKYEPPRRPRLFRKEISADLEAVMLKALEKDPKDRYPDAEAFARDLERALAGRRVSAHHFSPFDRLLFQCRRYRRYILMAVAGLVATGLVAMLFHLQLCEVRSEGLLDAARLWNTRYELSQLTQGREVERHLPPYWALLRDARAAVYSRDCAEALKQYNLVRQESHRQEDLRTEHIATLEMARCLSVLGAYEQADTLYQELMQQEAVMPAIREAALLDRVMVGLMQENESGVVAWLVEQGLPQDAQLAQSIRILTGEVPLDTVEALAEEAPPSLRNDLYMAAAIRCQVAGRQDLAQAWLRLVAHSSAPGSEWPAPLARTLLEGKP
jgi:serine/threonine-protein kinase